MAYHDDAQADYSHEFGDDGDAYAYGGDLVDFAGRPLINLTAAGNLTWDVTSGDAAASPSSIAEAALLFALATCGLALNAAVISSVVLCSRLRRLTNAFIVHGALVDAARCCLCLPYALGALRGAAALSPIDCDTLGTAEVVALSVAMFNLLAMALTEAYTFHVHNMDEFDTDRRGALLCVLFGVCMVYAAGLIIHLGPTLIGGHFQYSKGVGSCALRDYVLQAIWVAIVSLTVALIFTYIVKFYKQLKANDDFRLRVLGRAMAAYSRGLGGRDACARASAGSVGVATGSPHYFNVIRALQRRTKVLATIGASYVVCYYPLFFLTLIDRHREQPKVLYKILTYLAWSQAALAPLVFVVCDGSLGLVCGIRRCCSSGSRRRGRSAGDYDDCEGSSSGGAGTPKAQRENSRQPLTALTRDSSYAVSFAEKLGHRSNGGGSAVGGGGGSWRDRGVSVDAGAANSYVYAWPPPPNGVTADNDGDATEAGLATATWIERHPAAAGESTASDRLSDADETAI